MNKLVQLLLLSLLLAANSRSALARAFSSTAVKQRGGWTKKMQKQQQPQSCWRHQSSDVADDDDNDTANNRLACSSRTLSVLQATRGGSGISSVVSLYTNRLEASPILTKSVTAGLIFALSDYLAQALELRTAAAASPSPTIVKTVDFRRVFYSLLVGLLYFGPASHFWYDAIFRYLPGTSFWSTIKKAALGQLVFGSSFTCLFFGVALMQSGQFSLKAWVRKIGEDLPKAWVAGAGFWPLMDFISYSYIRKDYIPLFINVCSLFWTIYLSLIANR